MLYLDTLIWRIGGAAAAVCDGVVAAVHLSPHQLTLDIELYLTYTAPLTAARLLAPITCSIRDTNIQLDNFETT